MKMQFDICDLIGCMSLGLKEDLRNETFPLKWWQKKILKWLLLKHGLCTPLGYMQQNAWLKYKSKRTGA